MEKIIKLFQISDSHCYSSDESQLEWSSLCVYPNDSLKAMIAHLKEIKTTHQALMFTGDIAQEETSQTYQEVNKWFADFPIPVHAIPGNHDVTQLMSIYLKDKINLSPIVRFGEWHAFMLDTRREGDTKGYLDDLKKLEIQLNDVQEDHYIILFMHHHPLDVGSEVFDTIGLQRRSEFWNLLEKYPQVKAVFHGHTHQDFSGIYQFNDKRKIHVFGTPATCVQVKPKQQTPIFDHANPGWREIILFPNGEIETNVNYISQPDLR